LPEKIPHRTWKKKITKEKKNHFLSRECKKKHFLVKFARKNSTQKLEKKIIKEIKIIFNLQNLENFQKMIIKINLRARKIFALKAFGGI